MSPLSSFPSERSGRGSRLGVKIGLVAGLVAGLATALLPETSIIWSTAVALGTSVATYVSVYVWVSRRLRPVSTLVQQIADRQFDALSTPASESPDEVGRLHWKTYRTGQSIETEIAELNERESFRREFIGNVSHELKTPIFSVQGFAETLLDGALDDEDVNRAFLNKILHHTERLENLARDLSTITKIETNELNMSHEAFQVADLVDATVESVEVRANEKNVSIRQDVAPNIPRVYGDKNRLHRVLVNLADNAIKYNEEGGTVDLRARETQGSVAVSVEDDGIGIAEDHLPRLTERFYRVDKSRSRNQGGTGLGLAIVKHILAAHDCTLQVESTPGEGSTFRFHLPTSPPSSFEEPSGDGTPVPQT